LYKAADESQARRSWLPHARRVEDDITRFVADPLGRMLKKASHDKEENLIVTCDLGAIEEVRKDWPFLTCRRTEQY
jgi:predicted amidohydrolase